jgi:hypothetical protein
MPGEHPNYFDHPRLTTADSLAWHWLYWLLVQLVWLLESEMPLFAPILQAISMSYADIGVLVRLELRHYENGTHSLPLYICELLKGRDRFLFEYRTSP